MPRSKKAVAKTDSNKPDLSVEEAMATLKEEILHECRLLAHNRIMTVYTLIEKTKELEVLEKAQGIVGKTQISEMRPTH